MNTELPIRSIAKLLDDLKGTLHDTPVSIGDLLESLHERGIAMILLLFAAPMALPVPVPPGVSIVLGTPIFFLTIQQAIGAHKIWLPSKIKQKTFSGEKLKHALTATIPWMQKIEIIIKPRLGILTQNGFSRLFGAFGVIMAIAICLPIPLANTVPSFGISLMSIGFIMRDGFAVLAGALIGIAWTILLLTCYFIFGIEAFEIIKETIKSMVVP